MESHLVKSGDWQGTAMTPASDTLAFFAFMRLDGSNYETWTEPVIAWVMVQQRDTGGQVGTVFHGLALLQVGGTEVYRRPDTCEERHDERGCLIGYARGALTEEDMPAWNEAARDHLKQCRRRQQALGG